MLCFPQLAGLYQKFLIHILQGGNHLPFGDTNAEFIGIGGSIFLTITLLMFTVSHLIGHFPPSLLEVMTTLVGAVLMISAGALAVQYYDNRYSRNEEVSSLTSTTRNIKQLLQTGFALGVIAIITGIILAVDFLLSLRTLKISIG